MADPRYKALLIGNSQYPRDRTLGPLQGPANNVVALREALIDARAGLFPPEAVWVMAEGTVQGMPHELEGFFAAASKGDVLLRYYSGCALLGGRG